MSQTMQVLDRRPRYRRQPPSHAPQVLKVVQALHDAGMNQTFSPQGNPPLLHLGHSINNIMRAIWCTYLYRRMS